MDNEIFGKALSFIEILAGKMTAADNHSCDPQLAAVEKLLKEMIPKQSKMTIRAEDEFALQEALANLEDALNHSSTWKYYAGLISKLSIALLIGV